MSANKKLTADQAMAAAAAAGIEYPALRAVLEVECKGSGFLPDGLTPVILFERHVFWQRLATEKKLGIQLKASQQRPDLCNRVHGGYGPADTQHARLQAACGFDRTAALESASWGIGQVMGYHWQDLKYTSLQDFINAMYRNEASQLDAAIRYIQTNNLIAALNRQDWKSFAYAYNGKNYADNQYDTKLAAAYKKFNVQPSKP